jgi:hypothetical protein
VTTKGWKDAQIELPSNKQAFVQTGISNVSTEGPPFPGLYGYRSQGLVLGNSL